MTGHRSGGNHGRAHQQRATAGRSLAPLEVAVAGARTDLPPLKTIRIHRETHRAARLTPLKPRIAKHLVQAFRLSSTRHLLGARNHKGLDQVFRDAGFEWREPGCSMCLAMNPDRLEGRQISASSSNRNFKGRQGSASGRTLLMSPAMVAAAAVTGHVSDVRLLEA